MVLKNKIVKIILFAGIINSLFSGKMLYSQNIPSVSDGELTFYLDYACFLGNDGKSFIDFNLMFYSDQFKWKNDSEKLISEIIITTKILNESGEEISKNSWILEAYSKEENSDINSKVIYDKWNESLFPGNYLVEVSAFDIEGKLKGLLSKNIIVPQIKNFELSISDVLFLSSAEQSDAPSQFVKGNLNAIPNPSRRFGILNPRLIFYYEIYGLSPAEKSVKVNYQILDDDRNSVKDLGYLELKNSESSISVIHGIDVSTLKTGNYTLNITLFENPDNKLLNTQETFEIIQADYFQPSLSLDDEQEEIFTTILSYLDTPETLKFFKGLNKPGKSEFIIRYWKNLDPDPSSSENEYLQEIQKRFSYSTEKFSWGNIAGWKTERARILIKYGFPDELEQFRFEENSKPYEIWYYNKNKRYYYIFGDVNNNGAYILLHSNRESEVFNPAWRSLLSGL